MLRFLKTLTCGFIFSFGILRAQASLGITSLPPDEASQYAQPMATFLGTYFNSGGYYSAALPQDFQFRFSIIGMYIVVPSSQQTFSPNPGISGYSGLGETATIAGSTGGTYLGPQGFITYPHGFDISSLPSGIYQIAGSYYGTELLLRYFPKVDVGDVETGFFGIGLAHNISQWLEDFPVDLAVQLLYNTFGFEYTGDDPKNYIKTTSSNFAVNAHASKTFEEMFTVYGGLQYESSSMDMDYYFRDPNDVYPQLAGQTLSATVDGKNHFRFTAGGAVKLSVVVVNVDLNVTSMFTLAAGLSFQF